MIMTGEQYQHRLDQGEPFDLDMAMTVASWWYAPSSPELTALATMGKIINKDDLIDEIDHEQMLLLKSTAHDREDSITDLNLLRDWVRHY